MIPLSNKEVYYALINVDNVDNEFLVSIMDYLKNVIKCSHTVSMNEMRKSKKFDADLTTLCVVSNTGDISILSKKDQEVLKILQKQ